jgi:hypothetical protein
MFITDIDKYINRLEDKRGAAERSGNVDRAAELDEWIQSLHRQKFLAAMEKQA